MIESTEKFWEAIYSQNIAKMIGICYRYTANRPLSEDLAHDAFLKAIDKSGGFEGKGSFESWLRKIVVNHVLQYIRDQKKKKHIDEWLHHESNVIQPDDTNLFADSTGQSEFSETELWNAINTLPEHHRLVFNLYVVDNFSHNHIGEVLGISAGTSKSHLARARKKLKQVLEQKATKKRDRKTSILLFFFSNQFIAKLYREQSSTFKIPPKKIVAPDISGASVVPMIKTPIVTSLNLIIAAASVGIILTMVFTLSQWSSYNGNKNGHVRSTIHNEDKDQKLTQEIKNDQGATGEHKNYSPVKDSNTATIFANSVIHKNINNKSMKRLDSLSLMFLVSSSIMFDTTAQSNSQSTTSVSIEKQMSSKESKTDSADTFHVSTTADVKIKKQHGTFYASSLFWSGKNNELYFKGNVRIDVGDNDFQGDGTFTFLGPVYHLVVSGTPYALNSTIKLSKKQYRLTMLDSNEATKKYGEKGQQGAVEIVPAD